MKDGRELFTWQRSQGILALTLWNSLDMDISKDNKAQHNAQLKALLDALTSFMLVSTGDMLFENGLLHFLAVLSIDASTHRLRTAKNYSYIIAGVVYCIRVLCVE